MAARNQENVANDINKEVLINWPVNVDIVSAKCMERKLSNCKADEWKILLVKILAVGGKCTFFKMVLLYICRNEKLLLFLLDIICYVIKIYLLYCQ